MSSEFLPPDATSSLKPMDLGVTKTLYRGMQVRFILDSIEGNLITSDTTARHISSKISILNATHYAADNWRSVTSNVIQHCIASCGFISDISALQQDCNKMTMRDVTVVSKDKKSIV